MWFNRCQCFTILPPHVLEGRTYLCHYISSRMHYFCTLWGLAAVRSIWCVGIWRKECTEKQARLTRTWEPFHFKKTASPANLILHVKKVCFLVSAFFQGRYSLPRDLARNDAVFPTSLTHLLRVPVSEFANKGTACSRI